MLLGEALTPKGLMSRVRNYEDQYRMWGDPTTGYWLGWLRWSLGCCIFQLRGYGRVEAGESHLSGSVQLLVVSNG
jgi:hypothetical protein